jgi:hypothetical protein
VPPSADICFVFRLVIVFVEMKMSNVYVIHINKNSTDLWNKNLLLFRSNPESVYFP